MILKNKLLKKVGYSSLAPISQAAKGYLILPVITKYLSVSEVGIWSQLFAIQSFIYLFVNLNLTHAMTRFLPAVDDLQERSQKYWTFWFPIMLNSLIAMVLLVCCSRFFAGLFFRDVGYANIVVLLGVYVVTINLFNNIFSFFRSIRKNEVQGILFFVKSMLELALVYYFLSRWGTLYSAVFASLVAPFLVSLVGYFIAFKTKALIFLKKIGPIKKRLKEYLLFSIPLLPSSISHWLINMGDRFIILYFLGSSDLGLYFPINRIALLLVFLQGPINSVFLPELSRRYDKGMDIIKLWKKLMIYGGLVFVALYVFVVFSSEYLLKILTDKSQYLSVIDLIPILGFGYLLQAMMNINFIVLNVMKKVKLIGLLWIFISCTNILLNVLFVKSFGLKGIAIGTMLSFVLGFIITMIYLYPRRRMKTHMQEQGVLLSN